jgi:formylmethanofuran dehydrogenase subunit D
VTGEREGDTKAVSCDSGEVVMRAQQEHTATSEGEAR